MPARGKRSHAWQTHTVLHNAKAKQSPNGAVKTLADMSQNEREAITKQYLGDGARSPTHANKRPLVGVVRKSCKHQVSDGKIRLQFEITSDDGLVWPCVAFDAAAAQIETSLGRRVELIGHSVARSAFVVHVCRLLDLHPPSPRPKVEIKSQDGT
jgi:hypothetical protein